MKMMAMMRFKKNIQVAGKKELCDEMLASVELDTKLESFFWEFS